MFFQKKKKNTDGKNLDSRFIHLNDNQVIPDHYYCSKCNPEYNSESNEINTYRYNKINALPLSLYEQLKKPANLYFLFCAFLSLIPASPYSPFFSFFPIIFVISLSIIQDIRSDFFRRKLDKSTNLKNANIIKNNQLLPVNWKDIHAGDLVLVRQEESFPTDLLILGTEESSGICFIETSNFDGETDLKIKQANPLIFNGEDYFELAKKISLRIQITNPNPLLNNQGWNSKVILKNGQEIILNTSNFIPRTCVLKNTRWVLGCAVYTGKDSKIAQNSVKSRYKVSSISLISDKLTFILISFQFFYCFILTFHQLIWKKLSSSNDSYWYLNIDVNGNIDNNIKFFPETLYSFCAFFLISQFLIPISLIITLDLIRYIQTIFITKDLSMYDSELNYFPVVNTPGLNEDLGRVAYILSDKTGTLTQNKMKYKNTILNSKLFGNKSENIKNDYYLLPKSIEKENDSFGDLNFFENLIRNNQNGDISDIFMVGLSSCHSAVTNINKENDLAYQTNSPDEKCILIHSAKYGYYFYGRKNEKITILDYDLDGQVILINIKGKQHVFEIVDFIEFTSARKKMSVVVRDLRDGKLRVISKGADSVICDSLKESEKNELKSINSKLSELAETGLRTLTFGYKEIDAKDFIEWKKESTKSEEKLLEYENKLEKELNFLGVTAIEDTLQENLSETIKIILDAGIKFWMITGDKIETAINIASTAQIIPDYIIKNKNIIIIDSLKENLLDYLVNIRNKVSELKNGFAIVVTGEVADNILESKDRLIKDTFFNICSDSISLVCCRASPKQKEKLVNMVKEKQSKIVMSIGDGANDVPMLTAADIGIGIMGLEGTEAATSSDISVGRFSHIKSLLFVHGNFSYYRICSTMNFYYFKNITFATIIMVYSYFNGFSGSIIGHSSFCSFYNLFFTFLPALSIGIFDSPFSKNSAIGNPLLYQFGIQNKFFDLKKIFLYIGLGLYFGLVNLFSLIYFFTGPGVVDGKTNYLPFSSTASITSLVIVVNIFCIFEVRNWNSTLLVCTLGSVILWFFYLLLFSLDSFASNDYYFIAQKSFTNPYFYSYIIITLSLSFLPYITIKYFVRLFYSNNLHLQQEKECGLTHKSVNSIKKLVKTYDLKDILKLKTTSNFDKIEPGYIPFGIEDSDENVRTLRQKEILNLLSKNK